MAYLRGDARVFCARSGKHLICGDGQVFGYLWCGLDLGGGSEGVGSATRRVGLAGGLAGFSVGLFSKIPFFFSLSVSFASLFVVSELFLRSSFGCCVASHSFYLLHFTSRSSHSPSNRHLSSLLSSNISSRLAISFALSMRRLSPSFPSPSLFFINVPDRSLL